MQMSMTVGIALEMEDGEGEGVNFHGKVSDGQHTKLAHFPCTQSLKDGFVTCNNLRSTDDPLQLVL